MRTIVLTLAALLLTGLGGCMRTYRVEQSSIVNAGLNSDGTSSCCSQSSRQEREWHGLWPAQPDQIRP
jgi:hypothetical protein